MYQARHSLPSDVIADDHISFLPQPFSSLTESAPARLHSETALYLGLFSLTPLLLVFSVWAVLPVAVLIGAALWAVYKLHRDRIEAFTLHISAWTMATLSISTLLMSPAFAGAEALIPFTGMIYSVALTSLLILPLFALVALRYGIRNQTLSAKQLVGMGAATLHALGWVAIFVTVGLTGFQS